MISLFTNHGLNCPRVKLILYSIKVVTTSCFHYLKGTWPMSDCSNSCIWSVRRILPGWLKHFCIAPTLVADILEMIHQQTSQHSSNSKSTWNTYVHSWSGCCFWQIDQAGSQGFPHGFRHQGLGQVLPGNTNDCKGPRCWTPFQSYVCS